MDIALLLTGNELMSGDTVDTNSSLVAKKLAPCGFNIAHKVTVGDRVEQLVAELDRLGSMYSVVIVNGGLGPTTDDLTAEALVKLSDSTLVQHPAAVEHLEQWCKARGAVLNAANLKQAYLPEKANVIANPIGSAVGIAMHYKDCLILCTPGVPSELTGMLEGDIPVMLSQSFPHAKSRFIRRLRTFGLGESAVQQKIHDHIDDWPEEIIMGFRAGSPLLEIKLEAADEDMLEKRDECEKQLHAIIGDYIIGENDETMAEVIVSLLAKKNKRVAVAESCTGGLIASDITAIAGASQVFEAGFVTYSNTMKERILNVDRKLLDTYGAVSSEVVEAMAQGALEVSSADYAIAVSGIAGPDGGTDEKPVGTVWIAWGSSQKILTREFRFPSSRKFFQQVVAALGLDVLRRLLLGILEEPEYFRQRRR